MYKLECQNIHKSKTRAENADRHIEIEINISQTEANTVKNATCYSILG